MIQYLTQRYEPYGDLCGPPITREMTPGRAVTSLVRFELGYGGSITDLHPDCITVRTSMLGRYDITKFSGDPQEMMPLLRAVAFWLDSQKQHGSEHIAQTAQQAINFGFNRPLLLQMFSSLMWSPLVPATLCVAANLSVKRIHDILDRNLDDKKLDPVVELIIDGQPVEEALELLEAA